MLSDAKLNRLHAAAAANAQEIVDAVYRSVGVADADKVTYDEAVQAMMTMAIALVFPVAIMAELNDQSPLEQAQLTMKAFLAEVQNYEDFEDA